MTASKNYLWQKAWAVDLQGRTCTHDLGLVFEWSDARAGPAAAIATAPDGAQWFAAVVGGQAATDAWLAAQPSIRDPRSKSTRLQRVCREASEAWASALAGAWRAHRRLAAIARDAAKLAATHPAPRVMEIANGS